MSKNLIAFLIVFIGVLSVAFYIYTNNTNYLKNQTQTQTQTQTQRATPADEASQPSVTLTEPEKSNNKTVEIHSNRFAPNILEIKRGETIIWVNKDNKARRVASNPHPVHNDYPGFDSLKNLEEGQSYRFTFENSGVWGYHDHLNPNVEGRVSVRE